jgi:phosphoserine phosphatase
VVFDMDGVLFEGSNFWLELHRALGTERSALDLADRYMTSDYPRLATLTATRLWKGRPAKPMVDLVASRRYQPGVAELLNWLRREEIKTVLVSSGPYLLAARAQRELRIDMIAANSLGIQDGLISGELDLQVDDSNKGLVAKRLLRQLGVAPVEAAAIGDTSSDVPVARTVGLSIAYNSNSPELTEVADFVLPYGQLALAIPILEQVNSKRS